MNEWYFLDNPLRICQGYDLGKIEAAGIDPHTGYRRTCDARFSEDTAAEVRANRPGWRAHCLMVLPWHEIDPLGDGPERTLRFRRDVYAYEVPQFERILQVSARQLAIDTPTGVRAPTLRPLRHVVDLRPLAGAVHKGTLYIVESWP